MKNSIFESVKEKKPSKEIRKRAVEGKSTEMDY